MFNSQRRLLNDAVQLASKDGQDLGPIGMQEKMIAFQRKSLKVERDVAPENVYDLSIVRSLNEEMRKSK